MAIGIASAATVSYAPISSLAVFALAATLFAAGLLFVVPRWAAVVLGVSIPELQDVTGGRFGLHVAASDVVLVLLAARLLADAATGRRQPVLAALRRVGGPTAQYAAFVLVLLALHPGLGTALKSVQRLELLLLPMLAGAVMGIRRHHMLVLRGYVVAASVLAGIWPILSSHGLAGQFQKNPTGQLIVAAILLLIGVRELRRLLPCLPLLVVGLALTASRGALLALVVGVVVLSIVVGGRSRRILVARTGVIIVTGALMYQLLPNAVVARYTTLSTTVGAIGAYAIDLRVQYAHDAERIIRAHPWTGVGVGNYLAGDGPAGTQTTDPHDVILFEAAEGGYLFAVSFVCLIGGVVYALWRLRRMALAPVATAILLATTAHGLVDVYWVRGMPILGFLLVGMVCGLAIRPRETATR